MVNISPAEIKQIVLTDPTVLKHMLRNPNYDKRKITGIISQMFKYDVGLEFELFGSLSSLSKTKIHSVDKAKDRKIIDTTIARKLRVMSYSEDHYHFKSLIEQRDLNELRIRLRGHLGLVPLWNSLNYMRELCMIPKNSGGIHIHVDCTKYLYSKYDRDTLCEWFNKSDVQDRILAIFGGYDGTYNKPGCKVQTKGYYTNISRLDTVEFRIGKLTFDYSTISTWIYKCQLLVKEGLYQTKLAKTDRIKKFETVVNDLYGTREYLCTEDDECEPDEASREYINMPISNSSGSYTVRLTNSDSSITSINEITRTLNEYNEGRISGIYSAI